MPSPEVVPRLIRQIYQVRPDLKLPEAAIHAVLFEVRRALPRDNPGRERLPFYWYTHGPYSEIVRSSIEDLERRGILREETKAGKTLSCWMLVPPPWAVCARTNSGVSSGDRSP